eukprot:TRINITY_DN8822_c0_g1_i1.p1 TRINITY_DN8822_c0_g1~~TRINITY_DN8822_c0_g1_i1.p1  ORF type:complete len:467 (-),score=77.65 TRINITY_DN8822_c0_g1_i1:16-1311(-)
MDTSMSSSTAYTFNEQFHNNVSDFQEVQYNELSNSPPSVGLYPSLSHSPSAPPTEVISNPSPFVMSGPFIITLDTAQSVVEEQIASMWFLPTGFKKLFKCPPLEKHLVPYYLFNVLVQTEVKAKVLPRQPAVPHSPRTAPEWKDVNTNYTDVLSNILVCGTSSPKDRDLVRQLEPLDIPTTLIPHVQSLSTEKSYLPVNIKELLPYNVVWRQEGEGRAKAAVETKAENVIKTQEHAEGVKDTVVQSTFSNLTYQLIYLPFYSTSYVYDSKMYKILIDAQKAGVFVERPGYGLGKVGDVVKGTKNLVFTLLNWKSDVAVILGEKLGIEDGCPGLYTELNAFLVFPRSDSYLLTQSIGTVTVLNNGAESVDVIGQKRRGARRGNIVTIPSKSEMKFDYRGEWCIEIIRGRWEDIVIKECLTKGGPRGFDAGMV